MTSGRHDRVSAAAGLLVGAAALAIAVIKARAVSITHDEAVTYDLYVAGPWRALFLNYTAGNHFLFTVLARLSVLAFGAGELSLRLPALLASGVLVVALWTVLRRVTWGWFVPLGMAAVLFNPMLLDYLSMARGYGLSLAAFVGALGLALKAQASGFRAKAACAVGVALAVAVASNLTALIPSAALAIACAVLAGASRSRLATADAPRPSLPASTALMLAPIALAVLPHLAAMQWEIGRHHFWYGTSSLDRMLVSFDQRALFHQAPIALVPVDEAPRTDLLSAIVSGVISPALILGVLAAGAAALFARRRKADAAPMTPVAALLILCGTAIAATLAILVLAHAFAGLLYPRGRTGLCLGVLITLGTIAMALELLASPRRTYRIVGAVVTAVLIAFVVRFATQIRLDRFGEGYPEAHNREGFDRLETLRPAAPGAPFRTFAHSPVYGPSMDFYRLVRGAAWMAPVDRFVDPGVRYDAVIGEVNLAASEIARRHFRELWRDPDTGSVILVAK